jgi:hypothetical protein
MIRSLIMNWPFAKLALSTFVLVSYLFLSYQDVMIPAWHAAIWVVVVCIDDLSEYLDYRSK